MRISRRSALIGLGRAAALGAAAAPLAGFTSLEALFAPKAELWARWQAHDPDAEAVVDHGAWGRLLESYLHVDVDGVNRFAYAGVTAADRAALERYLARLAALPIDDYDRSEQLAYWINLYNALTVRVVLDHYPVDSIRDIDISPGLFADGPWGRALVRVAGEELSLNDIEHRILRPIWRDPRIHYAVNCAALGCPDLQPRPFAGGDVEARLTAAARRYVNSERGVRVRADGLVVSSIYVWFQEDFGGSDAAVIAHLARYAEPALAAALARAHGIVDHAYDWALNDYRGAGL
ncbi:MAG: DUF547 domain-containing protein [Kiloniellales bacterium]|nr:DUF547 domain-containing protein [Kiloniellales bacterium]